MLGFGEYMHAGGQTHASSRHMVEANGGAAVSFRFALDRMDELPSTVGGAVGLTHVKPEGAFPISIVSTPPWLPISKKLLQLKVNTRLKTQRVWLLARQFDVRSRSGGIHIEIELESFE